MFSQSKQHNNSIKAQLPIAAGARRTNIAAQLPIAAGARRTNIAKETPLPVSQKHPNQTALNNRLIAATRAGNFAQVKALLEQGAHVDARNKRNQTPLMLTIEQYPAAANTIELFLHHHANLNVRDNNGWTPITLATYHYGTRALETLMNAGVEVTHEQLNLLAPYFEAKLIKQLIKRTNKSIQQLFSSDLHDDALTHLLKSTNAFTDLLTQRVNGNFAGLGFRFAKKNLRKLLIESIDQACCRLTQEANPNDIVQMKIRMQRIANELAIIQKTSKDLEEKTAKRKLLMSIMLLDCDEQLKPLFNTLLTWLQQAPTPCEIETVIQSRLLHQPDATIANELQRFLTILSANECQKLKEILFNSIKKHSGEYKLEMSEGQPKLTIDLIKHTYDTYNKTQPAPALFQILRIHKSGTMNQDTGTWKAFVEAMEHGNFNRTAPAKSSLLGWFAKRKPDNQKGEEMREGPLLHKPQ